ncbi:Cytochrome b [hydrothermal vent metagenome]|uniref:Cytochrome b n=1 Tax=hydrothermal vent metagenome TaxID=652676 RepID=A0A3B0XBC1_9ZZZZ
MSQKIKVWDILVRIFHWSLVVAFITSYVSGEESSDLHIYSGYIILILILVRCVWGFIGSKYARFSNFVFNRHVVYMYLKSLLSAQPIHYTGHNPAGGWMVVALLISLFFTTISGLQLYAVEENAGPFSSINTEIQFISTAYADSDVHKSQGENDDEEFWEEIHEFFANFTLLLILIHIAGVFVSGKLHNENLVKAMIKGYKETDHN